MPRVIEHLFTEIHNRPETAYTVKVSYLEIYNESLSDLLAENPDADNDLQILEDNKGSIMVRGLFTPVANNEEEALSLMFQGETNRSIEEHQLNKNSTRSHCIFTVHLESRSRVESSGQTIYSKLHVVDLAGSERVGKTHSTGIVLKEAQYINKSLSFLEQVVIALSNPNRDHVPYRQSKLTHMLKDSLGGNCKTLLIANIWCEQAHLEETVSTLKFATRVMRVSNEATINIQISNDALIKKYETQVKELKQELAMHDQLKGITQVTYDPYTDEQRLDLRKMLKRYIHNEIEEVEIKNLRQIKEMFLQFKTIIKGMEQEMEELKQHKPSDTSGVASSTAKKSDQNLGEGIGTKNEKEGFGVGKAMAPNDKFVKKMEVPIPKHEETAAPNRENTQSPTLDEKPKEGSESTAMQKPDKNKAYENYKLNEGKEKFAQLQSNITSLVERKTSFKELGIKMNENKKQIDDLKQKIEEKESVEQAQQDNEVLDEEKLLMLKDLKIAKKQYREAYDQRKLIQNEIDFTSKTIDTIRTQLYTMFTEWYAQKYDSPAATPSPQPQAEEEDEPLDAQEKFEKLEMERIKKDDPESYSFFRAMQKGSTFKHKPKNTRTKKQ